MSDFQIALPDGRTIVVDAKDENEARNAARNFLMRDAASKRGAEGGIDNFSRSVVSGATSGFGDELAANFRATFPKFSNWMMGTPEHVRRMRRDLGHDDPEPRTTSTAPTWQERYDEELMKERAQSEGYAEAYPVWDTVGKAGGAVATIPFMPGAVVRGGTGLAGLARSAATGAGMGAVAGFGEGEGGFDERLRSAGEGAEIGGVAGAVLHPVAAGVGAVTRAAIESAPGRHVAERVVAPAMTAAADALDKVGTTGAATASGQRGVLSEAADRLRASAPSDILDNGSARRFGRVLREGGDDPASAAAFLDEIPAPTPLAFVGGKTGEYLRELENARWRWPKKLSEINEAIPKSEGKGLTSALRAYEYHQRIGNDAVRRNTIDRIRTYNRADEDRFLSRVAAQVALEDRPPYLQRGLTLATPWLPIPEEYKQFPWRKW